MASLIAQPEEDNILTRIHTAQVTADDLQDVMGRGLTEQELAVLQEFEQSWKHFVCSKRGKLPSGQREMKLKHLNEKVEELTKTRDQIEAELTRQLAFFNESQSKSEEQLLAKIEHEKKEYATMEKKLKEQLEAIEDAQKLQEETLPWSFFMSCVDAEAAAAATEQSELAKSSSSSSRTVKPSQRAMFLLSQYSKEGEPADPVRRAFQIDHALLKTQLIMLNKQIQRYEKTIASQELANVFLMENNVWSILKDE